MFQRNAFQTTAFATAVALTAFQPSAFQQGAFQRVAVTETAFQPHAFQLNAFQQAIVIEPAFQAGAFQQNAFQTAAVPAAPATVGALAYNDYARERARLKRLEREELADRLAAQLAAEGLIAPDGAAERLQVREYAKTPDLLNRRAQRAVEYALKAQTELAWQLALREIARQLDEEEYALLLLLATV